MLQGRIYVLLSPPQTTILHMLRHGKGLQKCAVLAKELLYGLALDDLLRGTPLFSWWEHVCH